MSNVPEGMKLSLRTAREIKGLKQADVTERLTAAEQELAGMGNVIDEAVEEGISAVSGGLRFAQDGNGTVLFSRQKTA